MKRVSLLIMVFFIIAGFISCEKEREPAYITPNVSLSEEVAPLNSPLTAEYSFVVSREMEGEFPRGLIVFVHFLDGSGEIVFQDDHPLPKESSQLKPGETISYSRMVFIPSSSPLGPVKMKIGLYNEGGRTPLIGNDEEGDRAYTVAKFKVVPEDLNKLPLFKEGWYQAEYRLVRGGPSQIEQWSWTKEEAKFSFLNPKKDSALYLSAHSPVVELKGGQRVSLSLNGKKIASFDITSPGRFWKKIELTADIMGEEKWIEFTLRVDKTFVPAKLKMGTDERELGLQVFHICLK